MSLVEMEFIDVGVAAMQQAADKPRELGTTISRLAKICLIGKLRENFGTPSNRFQ